MQDVIEITLQDGTTKAIKTFGDILDNATSAGGDYELLITVLGYPDRKTSIEALKGLAVDTTLTTSNDYVKLQEKQVATTIVVKRDGSIYPIKGEVALYNGSYYRKPNASDVAKKRVQTPLNLA